MKSLKYQTTLGERIRKILEVISPILVDGNLTFDKTGLSIQGMTNQIYVKLKLPPSGAESFQSWEDRTSIGLDFKCLSGWMKAVSKGDIISFEVSKKELEAKKKPTLTYKHWNDRMNHEVRLPILDIEEFKTEEKDFQYDSIITMSSSEFEDFIKRHGVGATDIRFQTVKSSTHSAIAQTFLVLHSFGMTPGETTKPCFTPNFTGKYKNLNLACDKEERFSIKTLKTVAKAYTVSESVNIHLSKKEHLLLSYQLGQLGSLEFRLVPKKNTEEKLALKKEPVQAEDPIKFHPIKRKASKMVNQKNPKKAKVEKEKNVYSIDDFIEESITVAEKREPKEEKTL